MKKSLLLSMIFLAACSRLLATPTSTPLPTHTPVPPSATPLPVTITPSPAVATATGSAATRAVPPVASTPLPTPSPAVDFNFNAPDGAKIAVTYYPPIVRPAPAALLLHMLGRNKGDWEAFAKTLQKQGWAVMAMDLRGHGASAGPADWTKSPGDVEAAMKVLAARPEVDPNRTAIVGASIGSNLALIAGAADSRISAVAALSPGLDYMGLKPGDTIDKFGDRPVLLVASEDDSYSAEAVKQLAPKLIGGKAKIFTNAGHGNAMFSDATLEPTLVDWLNTNVRDLK